MVILSTITFRTLGGTMLYLGGFWWILTSLLEVCWVIGASRCPAVSWVIVLYKAFFTVSPVGRQPFQSVSETQNSKAGCSRYKVNMPLCTSWVICQSPLNPEIWCVLPKGNPSRRAPPPGPWSPGVTQSGRRDRWSPVFVVWGLLCKRICNRTFATSHRVCLTSVKPIAKLIEIAKTSCVKSECISVL